SVMRSVVQEKTSRVMELMVATIKPRSLMAGKILGVGAAGLVQITIWLAIGAVTLKYRDQLLGAFGVHGGGAALPPIGFADVAILLASTVLVARAAAKIYRVGVLMYGKRPGVQELIRWLRY